MSYTTTAITEIGTATVRPISASTLPHYYQGRPNVVFLDRFKTQQARQTRRAA